MIEFHPIILSIKNPNPVSIVLSHPEQASGPLSSEKTPVDGCTASSRTRICGILAKTAGSSSWLPVTSELCLTLTHHGSAHAAPFEFRTCHPHCFLPVPSHRSILLSKTLSDWFQADFIVPLSASLHTPVGLNLGADLPPSPWGADIWPCVQMLLAACG